MSGWIKRRLLMIDILVTGELFHDTFNVFVDIFDIIIAIF